MELFLIYLWLKLDVFIFVSVALALILLLVFGFYYIIRNDDWLSNNLNKDESYTLFDKKHGWLKKTSLITAIFSIIFAIVTPSAKDTAILVGASYAIDLAKSPEGQKISLLIRKKANDFLDEQLKEKK